MRVGIARLPAFKSVVSSISFRRMAFRPRNSTLVEQGHLPHREDQGPLAALGRRLIDVVPDVGEPFGPHQGLQVGLDLVLIERLADPAQELGLDLVGGDRGVSLELDLGDRSLRETSPPVPGRSRLDDDSEDHGNDTGQTDRHAVRT